MKILVFGGTRFVGRHIVEALFAGGHAVTLFNRGKTNPKLFPAAEKLIGDRDGGLDVLEGSHWDAAIDVNGYIPRLVEDSSRSLANMVERYIFISTISVYANFFPLQAEDAPLDSIEDPNTEEITADTYGPLKATCEQVAEASMPNRVLILRPGHVAGPHDYTDRFTYWVRSICRGGEMLAPGDPDLPIQFIDARDLAAFTVRMAEEKSADTYNVTGPKSPTTWTRVFEEAKSICSSNCTFTWVSEAFLEEHQVTGLELPLWTRSEDRGIMQVNCEKAQSAGLIYRPLSETIVDTFEWDKAHSEPRAGLSPSREAELLEAWSGSETIEPFKDIGNTYLVKDVGSVPCQSL